MSKIVLVDADFRHIYPIAVDLREADRREIEDSVNVTPQEAITHCLSTSTQAWTVLVDDTPAGVVGVAPIPGAALIGSPWFLGTPLMNSKAFAKVGKLLTPMHGEYPVLLNYIAEYQTASIRWLRKLGFTVKDEIAEFITPSDVKFYQFMRTENVRNSHVGIQ